MGEWRLHLEGPEPAATAAALERMISDTFGANPGRRVQSRVSGGERPKDVATGLALAGLVLSVPGAAQAAVDLAQRLPRRASLRTAFGSVGRRAKSHRRAR
jgi:hypothetical protein